jgi:RNA polymerase sigma-70 factor (ECF subfamily)
MEHPQSPDDLMRLAGQGDKLAVDKLFELKRLRLRTMIAFRMDPRLSSRIDASDVVQEAFIEAHRLLDDYLKQKPIPFYPWLRQIALNRLIDLHRRHLLAKRRSVLREEAPIQALPDASVYSLADQFLGSATSPSGQIAREEQRAQVYAALLQLKQQDRELLVLRYLEKLSNAEIAAVLGISEGAVKVRHFRALERLRPWLADQQEKDEG